MFLIYKLVDESGVKFKIFDPFTSNLSFRRAERVLGQPCRLERYRIFFFGKKNVNHQNFYVFQKNKVTIVFLIYKLVDESGVKF